MPVQPRPVYITQFLQEQFL